MLQRHLYFHTINFILVLMSLAREEKKPCDS